jgi:hypothetical protein
MKIDWSKIPAISVRQPFAWLIVEGLKDIENRDWKLFHRGPVLIHAGLNWYDVPVDELEKYYDVQIPGELPRGGIVGLANAVDCVTQSSSKWFQGEYGFVLQDARKFDLVPCRGRLNLFRPPADVIQQVKTLVEPVLLESPEGSS